MKQRVCALAMVLMMAVSLMISAEARLITPTYSLDFNGTTAVCDVDIYANHTTDKIIANIKLWDGNTCLKTWTEVDYGALNFSETYSSGIQAGKTYEMTVSYTIAGKGYPQDSVSAYCPG